MEFKNTKKYHQDFWKGSSREEQFIQALLPTSLQIDDLSAYQLFKFVDEFSKSIHFHNEIDNNKNWHEILNKNDFFRIMVMAAYPLNIKEKRIKELAESYRSGKNTSQLSEATHFMLDMLLDFIAWTDLIYKAQLKPDIQAEAIESVVDMLKTLEKDILVPSAIRVLALESRTLPHDKNPEVLKQKFINIRKFLSFSTYGLKADTDEELTISVEIFIQLMNRLFYSALQIVEKAKSIVSYQEENSGMVQPHIAIFYAFTHLYTYTQGKINELNKKHLEFYFNTILKQNPESIKADEVFVVLGLKKDTYKYLLEKGTEFLAGKDKNGKDIIYESAYDAFLNNAKIAAVNTLFVSRNKLNYSGLRGRPITDIFSKSQIDFKNEPNGWAPFGEDQFYKSSENKTMDIASIGFAIASDAFNLKASERDFALYLEFSPDTYLQFKKCINDIAADRDEKPAAIFNQIFNTAFDLYLSLNAVEEQIERFAIKDSPLNHAIIIHFRLESSKGSMEGTKNKTHDFQTNKPYIRLMLKSESHIYLYPLFTLLKPVNIRIEIKVIGYQNFTLLNNFGTIDLSVPQPLFGALPKLGSYFMINSQDIFSKNPDNITVNIDWFQNPQGSWSTYFSGYDLGIKDEDYQVSLSFLNHDKWFTITKPPCRNLFQLSTTKKVNQTKLSNKTTFREIKLSRYNRDRSTSKTEGTSHQKKVDSLLKFELTAPSFAFGHQLYAKKLSEVVLHNSKLKKAEANQALEEPNPPLSPLVSNVSVDFNYQIAAFEKNKATNALELFQISPFGYKKVNLGSRHRTFTFIEEFQDEGNLYIGLDQYPPEGKLYLFFDLMEGRVEDFIRTPPQPKWQYLADNQWMDFDKKNIIADSTNGFIQSGIIRLIIPEQIKNDNSLMDPRYFWIKTAVKENANIAAKVKAIYTNAVRLRWNENADFSHLETPLPAFSIKKMRLKNAHIASVSQPLASFGGIPLQEETQYYNKVSKRLRHKNRVVSKWDIEHLVLEQFPIVYKVKCFTGNSLYHQLNSEHQHFTVKPGTIKVVVLADHSNELVRNALRPKLGIEQLIEIQQFLSQKCSPFVQIDVANPLYDRIKVSVRVRFKGSMSNTGSYLDQLNHDLFEFLTPWLGETKSTNDFGSNIYKSDIMSFIQSRPYIAFATGFSIIKTWNETGSIKMTDTARENIEEINPTFPWSILVSAEIHDIQVIESNTYLNAEKRGIENMELGSDFIITS